MRITFIITGLATGGAEMMLYKILENSVLLRRGGNVIALRGEGEMVERIRSLGIRVDCLDMRPGTFDLPKMFRLYQMLRLEKPDVISTWMYHADFVGGIMARLIGVPSIWGVRHSDISKNGINPRTRIILKMCALLSSRIPKKIATCSFRARDVHVESGYHAIKFIVIPNGFDLDRFRPDIEARRALYKELGLADSACLIGLIGRFDPIKNHEGFVQAAALIAAKNENAYFLLAGNGVDQGNATLWGWIRRAGLEDRFYTLGLRKDVERITAALDVAVNFSWGEAFSNAIGEAMACGVPCVVSDVGDSAFIVDDAGIVISPGNVDELARAVYHILALPDEKKNQLGERARERVMQNFAIGEVARRYEKLFQEAIV